MEATAIKILAVSVVVIAVWQAVITFVAIRYLKKEAPPEDEKAKTVKMVRQRKRTSPKTGPEDAQ